MPRQPLTRDELDGLAAYLGPALRRVNRAYDRLTVRGVRDTDQQALWQAAKDAADAVRRLADWAALVTAADEPAPGPATGHIMPPRSGPGGQNAPPSVAVADGPPTDPAVYEQISENVARAMRGRRCRH